MANECLVGFIQAWHTAQSQTLPPPANFEEFIHQRFGPGIARHFMIPYNQKLWGHPRENHASGARASVPIPTMPEVVRGAVGANPPELGYNTSFLYPAGRHRDHDQGAHRGIDRTRGEVRTGVSPDVIDVETREVIVGEEHIRPGDRRHPAVAQASSSGSAASPPTSSAPRPSCAAPGALPQRRHPRPPPADYHWIYVPERK